MSPRHIDPHRFPRADDSERRVVACILRGSPFARELVLQCRPDDFWNASIRDWVARARELAERDEPIDASVLLRQVNVEEKIPEAHEAGRLMDGVDVPPSLESALWNLGRVRQAARDRRLLEQMERGCAALTNGRDPETVAEVLGRIAELSTSDGSGYRLQPTDLAAEPPASPAPLIGDAGQQLIVAGDFVAVAGDSGGGKSMLFAAAAHSLAAGAEFLGWPCRQSPVLLVSSDGDHSLPDKVRRFALGRGFSIADLAGLPLRVVDDDGFNLDRPECLSAVIAGGRELGFDKAPGVLIVESLATNVAPETNLNDQQAVRGWATRTIRRLQADFPGLTICLSAHLKKPQPGVSNDLGNRVAGSVQIRAAVDCLIGAIPCGREAFQLRLVKRSRTGGTFEPLGILIEGAPGEPLKLVNTGPTETSAEELRGAAAAILTWMRSGHPKAPLTWICTAMGDRFRRRAVQAACKRLSESEPPRLLRTGDKPATYALPPRQPPLEGIE